MEPTTKVKAHDRHDEQEEQTTSEEVAVSSQCEALLTVCRHRYYIAFSLRTWSWKLPQLKYLNWAPNLVSERF